MRKLFLDEIQPLLASSLPVGVNPKCEDPNCNHTSCIKDPETGDWYKREQIPCQPDDNELLPVLLAAQLKELKSVKSMLVFFTVLTVISLIGSIIIAVTL